MNLYSTKEHYQTELIHTIQTHDIAFGGLLKLDGNNPIVEVITHIGYKTQRNEVET